MDRVSSGVLVASTLFLIGGTGRMFVPTEAARGSRESAMTPVEVQQGVNADAFLAKLRGVDRVACDLVGHALSNNWGQSSVTPVLRLPGRTEESVEMARWTLGRYETDVIPRLRAALDDTDPCVRETAARMFDHVRDRRRAADELRRALEAPNPATQLAAVLALGYLEDRSTVSTLTQRLSSNDPAMRQVVAWALGRIEHADAVPALVEALGDADVGVRGNAAWALGRMERSVAVTPLTRVLRDPEVSVRLNATLALGQIEDPSAIPALSELLGSDRSAAVRKAAAWALGKIE